eukprot:TRINITY_DN6206_c1_g1_i4.p1 TRINITY_DN6206_c1_g1~~TRINITY_DN6206_c1_g1_i4.p1  ORF type:complete len:344 (-),score=91.51 TRINITY_DN6206_c1_g1_i4:28-972(-)
MTSSSSSSSPSSTSSSLSSSSTTGTSSSTTPPTSFQISLGRLYETNAQGIITNFLFNFSRSFTPAIIPSPLPFFKIVDDDDDGTPVSHNLYDYIIPLHPSGTFTLQFGYFDQPIEGQFASQNFKLPAHTLKCSFKIDNYTFSSSSNRLQMSLLTSTRDPSSLQKSSPCGGPIKADSSNNLASWISVQSSHGTLLYASFPSSILLDDKVSYSTIYTNKKDEGIVDMIIQAFNRSVIVDPNFSILLSPPKKDGFDSSCVSPSSLGGGGISWQNAVIGAVVCACATAAGIVGFAVWQKRSRANISKRRRAIELVDKP